VDIGNVPLSISVTPCSSVVSMTILWRTMPDDEDYYYDDDDDVTYELGVYCVNHPSSSSASSSLSSFNSRTTQATNRTLFWAYWRAY